MANQDFIVELIKRQNELMSRQLALLGGRAAPQAPAPASVPVSAPEQPVQPAVHPVAEPAVSVAESDEPVGAPLTPGQMEHWLAANFSQDACVAVNESICLSLEGDVDPAVLRRAVGLVLARHDFSRVAFDRKEPRQFIQALEEPVPVGEVDLSDRPDADTALEEFCREHGGRVFDLRKPPLFEAFVLRLAPRRAVFFLVGSHLVFDGWASSVLVEEIAEAYRAIADGRSPAWSPPESPLAFAIAEAARFNGPEGTADREYWKRVYTNPPQPVVLNDLSEQASRRFAAGTVRSAFDSATTEKMRREAKAHGVTLFQFMLAAVVAMLHRQSGHAALAVSVPYASQLLDERGPLVADGVLDLPILFSIDGKREKAMLLKYVRDTLIDALEHPLVTQGSLARSLGLRSKGTRSPITGIYFNLNPKIDLGSFEPLRARLVEGRKRGLLSELFFSFYEEPEGLVLDLHYSADLFTEARVRQLVQALWNLALEWIGEHGATPQVDATASLVQSWQGAQRELAPGSSIQGWVSAQAARTPDSVAVVASGRSLTYQELEHRANAIANVLRQRGVGVGSLVGICLGRSVDMLPAMLGVLKAGAGYVPLDPGFPADRLQFYAEDAGLAQVITEREHAELAGLPRGRQLRVDDDAALISAASQVDPKVDVPEDATAYVIYTSGSTGKPKGVVLPQRAVCNFLQSMRHTPGMTAQDVILAVTTLSFDIAVLELWLPLTVGAKIILAQREQVVDGRVLARLLDEHPVTLMQATPTTWQLLLEAGWKPRAGLKALCGGEALPPNVAQELTKGGVDLWNMYGPTETTVWSTVAQVKAPIGRIHIGRPIDNTQVWILDEALRPVPVGAEGEICIGGEGVATGYHNRPDLTAEKFIPDTLGAVPGKRIYRTGDLGRWTPEGVIEHLGRMDFQVKIRGYRIELGEIEARLLAQPGVARAVATVREDAPGDKRLVAYVVPKAGAQLDGLALRTALQSGVPDYMVPQHIAAIEQLPLLPNGKVDRKSLPAISLDNPAHGADGYVAPVTDVELALVPIWEDVLGTRPIGVLDDFYSLGGDSILAARLMARIEEATGHQLPLEALFQRSNIRGVAAAITDKLELTGGVIVPLREAASGPALILVAGVGGHVFAFHQFANEIRLPISAYGMKAVGIDGNEPALDSFEAIGKRYVSEILAVQPQGPYVIGGHSIGAQIAFETALQLEALGHDVASVIMFDMSAPGYPKPAPLHRRIRYHLRQMTKDGWRGLVRYVSGQARTQTGNLDENALHELELLGAVPREILDRVGTGLMRAGMQYKPAGKLKADIVVISAEKHEDWHEAVKMEPDQGWRDYALGRVIVRGMDAGHLDLFKEGYRAKLVGLVEEVLVQAGARP